MFIKIVGLCTKMFVNETGTLMHQPIDCLDFKIPPLTITHYDPPL